MVHFNDVPWGGHMSLKGNATPLFLKVDIVTKTLGMNSWVTCPICPSPENWGYAAQRWCWPGFWRCCLCGCSAPCWWPMVRVSQGPAVTATSRSALPELSPVPSQRINRSNEWGSYFGKDKDQRMQEAIIFSSGNYQDSQLKKILQKKDKKIILHVK